MTTIVFLKSAWVSRVHMSVGMSISQAHYKNYFNLVNNLSANISLSCMWKTGVTLACITGRRSQQCKCALVLEKQPELQRDVSQLLTNLSVKLPELLLRVRKSLCKISVRISSILKHISRVFPAPPFKSLDCTLDHVCFLSLRFPVGIHRSPFHSVLCDLQHWQCS